MNDRDRALVAEIRERDRRWSRRLPEVAPMSEPGGAWITAVADRRHLLRIVTELEAQLKGVVAADYVDEPLADTAP